MHLNDDASDWHLTPRGWEAGAMTITREAAQAMSEDFPQDRVLTCRCANIRGIRHGAASKAVKVVWSCGNYDLIRQLVDKYGDCLHCAETFEQSLVCTTHE